MSRRTLFAGVAAVAGVCACLVALVLDRTARETTAHDTSFPGETRSATSGGARYPLDLDAPASRGDEPRPVRERRRSGYRGTRDVRDGEADADAPPPGPQPRRDEYFASPERLASVARELTTEPAYSRFLRVLHRLGGAPEPSSEPTQEAHETTRFQREPERMAALLAGALEATRDGVRRQAILFHMAIALPPDVARPRLRAVWRAADPDEAEDALVALAFSGDAEALEAFEALSWTPSTARVHLLVNEYVVRALEARGCRDVLRSYRAIEALDRAPYFHIDGLAYDAPSGAFPWRDRTIVPTGVVIRLLSAWIRRYPGHCGTDDMAYRLALLHARDERWTAAVRWASRSATFPDQDMRRAAYRLLVTLVEYAPRGSDVLQRAVDPDDPLRNRTLLDYLMVRRRAVDAGFEAALADLEDLAEREPRSALARAFLERWAAPVPAGLDSGIEPLPPDDWLRQTLDAPPPETVALFEHSWPTEEERLDPPLAGSQLPGDKLRRQFRAWSTLAELARRADRAGPQERPDLDYKRAAVYYHEPYALFPVYGVRDQNDNGLPAARLLTGRRTSETEARDLAWLRANLSYERAIEIFDHVASTEAGHEIADRAAFSSAMAHVKCADTRVLRNYHDGSWTRFEVDRHIKAGVAAFEAMAQAHPRSPLADDARAAARWWRRACGRLWER